MLLLLFYSDLSVKLFPFISFFSNSSYFFITTCISSVYLRCLQPLSSLQTMENGIVSERGMFASVIPDNNIPSPRRRSRPLSEAAGIHWPSNVRRLERCRLWN